MADLFRLTAASPWSPAPRAGSARDGRGPGRPGRHVILNGRDPGALASAAARLREAGAVAEPAPSTSPTPRPRWPPWRRSASHARPARHPGQQCGHAAPRPGHRLDRRRLRAGDRDQPHRLLPPRPRGRAADAAPSRYGRIITTGSVGAILGRPTIHGYIAAKAGLHGLTRSLAAELGPQGHHGQRAGPRLLRDRAQHGAGQRRGVLGLGRSAHAARPLGRAPGARRRGRLPGLGCAAYVNGHVLAVDGGLSVSL